MIFDEFIFNLLNELNEWIVVEYLYFLIID